MYLLDTNACINAIRGSGSGVRARLLRYSDELIFVCSIVKAELFAGSAKSQTPIRSREKQLQFLASYVSLPFNDRCAESYGSIRSTLEISGTLIGTLDMMIAAIAITNNLTLVTHNTKEFVRVPNLKFEDWE